MRKHNWKLIQARFEAGEKASDISKSLGGKPAKQSINAKAREEGWIRREVADEAIKNLPVPDTYWDELDIAQQAVVEAFSLGAKSVEEAAIRADVSSRTIRRWRSDDRFNRLCQAARAAARDELVTGIKSFAKKEWRAGAWLLDRLWPDEFGEKTAPQGHTFNVLGHINLGIQREEIDVSPRDDQEQEA